MRETAASDAISERLWAASSPVLVSIFVFPPSAAASGQCPNAALADRSDDAAEDLQRPFDSGLRFGSSYWRARKTTKKEVT